MENQMTKPDNYMVWAILCTICCCLPFGIVAIINASKVDDLYRQGDYVGANNASENAKKWATYGAIVGIVVSVIYTIIYSASMFAMFAH